MARQLQFELDRSEGGAGGARPTQPVLLGDDQLEQLARRVATLLQPPRPGRAAQPSQPDSTPRPGSASQRPMDGPPPLVLPPPEFNQQWRNYLSQQRLINENYQTRDRQEIRVLLLATERPPADIQDQQFLQDRLKLFVIVGHRGWAAALSFVCAKFSYAFRFKFRCNKCCTSWLTLVTGLRMKKVGSGGVGERCMDGASRVYRGC